MRVHDDEWHWHDLRVSSRHVPVAALKHFLDDARVAAGGVSHAMQAPPSSYLNINRKPLSFLARIAVNCELNHVPRGCALFSRDEEAHWQQRMRRAVCAERVRHILHCCSCVGLLRRIAVVQGSVREE